jgi:hypothetical protein
MHWTNLLVDLKLWTITNTREVEYENKPFFIKPSLSPEGPLGSASDLVFGVARFPLAPVALEMIFESAR